MMAEEDLAKKFEQLDASKETKEKTEETTSTGESDTKKQAGDEEEEEELTHIPSKQLYEDTISSIHVQQSDPTSPLYSVNSFNDLGLSSELLDGIFKEMKYDRPSKIQEKALPLILSKPSTHLIAQSQSGTGKTAAFTLGVLSKVDTQIQSPQGVIVCPTRELARQIHGVCSRMGRYMQGLKILLAIPPRGEKRVPKTHIKDHVVIGTPGTISDYLRNKKLDTRHIKIVVIDEADHMLDIQSLGGQSKSILNHLPKHQVLCFSATWNDKTLSWAREVVPQHPRAELTIEVKEQSVEKITQLYIECGGKEKKYDVLKIIYGYISVGQSIIFVKTKQTAITLAQKMESEGYTVSLIHGDLKTEDRDVVWDQFAQGINRVLIATDVVSRGVDVLTVTLVINFDLPTEKGNQKVDPPTYLHRIGRAGRFGRSGIAINLVGDHFSLQCVEDLKSHYKRPIDRLEVDDIPQLAEKLRQLK